MHLLAPAKINVYLRILGRRADGYHLLDSFMVPVSLYDAIGIEVIPGRSEIIVTCDDPTLPCDETNLAYRAAALLCAETGVHARIAITLRKQIPVGAGLGGGSSDAAAVLKGLNIALSLNLSEAHLCFLAARLGADVPFFIPCRPCRVSGIGDILRPVPPPPPLPIVLVVPPFGIATPWAYRRFDELPASPQPPLPPLPDGQWPTSAWLINDLERAVFPTYPVLARLKEQLRTCGALGALMSGSGSAVFGFFPSRALAEKALIALQAAGRTFLVEPLSSPPSPVGEKGLSPLPQ
ncbi:MAG: 4-(cytidine 5'-diphospho)-2-C-methyl-D-erythritol kinase [Candidatus Binatia bacterium]|nr:4-(cytidine 5'-diphospho)-2-C-methyl-D-erythritol kinase [Candidatus Binatia bacterium]